jgi:hypothetical protein
METMEKHCFPLASRVPSLGKGDEAIAPYWARTAQPQFRQLPGRASFIDWMG